MKILKIFFIGILLFQIGCQVDPQEDIADSDWNKDRNVLQIKFNNQIGDAKIVRIDDASGSIDITVNQSGNLDMSNIKVETMILSYGASSSVAAGQGMDFNNASNTNVLTVTSQTGQVRKYTVKVNPFKESILGIYDIDDLVLYGGTGPEYGGSAVLPLASKPWIWPASDGPTAELDNTLEFTLEGITQDGNTYGAVINNSGADGKYANFLYIGSPQTDVNKFYRKIPKGTAKWARNYTANTITFTFADGSTAVGTLKSAGAVDLGNGKSKTIVNQSLEFVLNGVDDYVNIYSDYDKFVKNPRRFWIDVTKKP